MVAVMAIYTCGGVAVAVSAVDVQEKEKKKPYQEVLVVNARSGGDGRRGWALANMRWWSWWW